MLVFGKENAPAQIPASRLTVIVLKSRFTGMDMLPPVVQLCTKYRMAQRIIRFINTLTAALLVGIVFGVWAGFNPFDLSAVAYIEQQQNLIRQLNVPMPAVGFITILITLVAAFLHRNNKQIMALHIIAAVFLIITGLITRFGNQVINAQVITWNSMDPPGNWKTVRDQWWIFHCYRTVTALAALVILLWINAMATATAGVSKLSR